LFLALGGSVAAHSATPRSGTLQPAHRLEASVDAMGSTFTMVLYGADRAKLQAAADRASEEVRRLDRMLSNYIPASEWSELNRKAGRGFVQVSPELYRLIAACVDYSRASGGAFDITVGPLMKVWGFYKGSGRMPQPADIRRAMADIGYRNILLDPARHAIRFAREGVNLDPGGIGKGYAVDRMAKTMRNAGISSALIAASGSSIYGLGTPPGEPRGWRVGIEDPADTSKILERVYLKNESMSTSGDYEKFFLAGGRMWSHIMDPRTGYPAEGVASVSVIAPRTIDSEAWAKPFYINGSRWAAKHKPKDFRVFLCQTKDETNEEASCAWLQ
jgi:FAD:protein FMN transferase